MIKSNLSSKFLFLFKILLIYFAIFLKSYADNSNLQNNLIVVGSDDAAVKIKKILIKKNNLKFILYLIIFYYI